MDSKLEEVVNNVFDKYDVNKNGTLDSKEIQKFLNDVYTQAGRKPSNFSEANDLVKHYDINKDGAIDKKQMKQIIKKIMNLK